MKFFFHMIICLLLSLWLFEVIKAGNRSKRQPRAVCCGQHEERAEYFNNCTTRTLEKQRCYQQRRNCTEPCRLNACDCKSCYYRNERERCVPLAKCHKERITGTFVPCPDEFEQPIACYRRDKSRTRRNSLLKIKRKKEKKKRKKEKINTKRTSKAGSDTLCELAVCDCIPGYRRNKCNKCVRLSEGIDSCEQLPNDPCRGPNEDWVQCIGNKSEHTYKDLKQYGDVVQNQSPEPGRKKRSNKNVCDYKNGFNRNVCERCLRWTECHASCQCTNPCQDKHEKYRLINPCKEQTCQKQCFGASEECTTETVDKCDCKGSYCRDETTGKCVCEKIACVDLKSSKKKMKKKKQ